ncbi:unnamed protein product, partial [Staurois parvus]
QCLPPVPSSATHQCRPSVPPSSAAHQCPAVQSVVTIIAAHRCLLISAAYLYHLISAAYQCPSVLPSSAASSMHISEGDKLPVCKIL